MIRTATKADLEFARTVQQAKLAARREGAARSLYADADPDATAILAGSARSKPRPAPKNVTQQAPTSPDAEDSFGENHVFAPLQFDNAYEFHQFFWPKYKLYDWQRETLLQISGFPTGRIDTIQPLVPTAESPLIYNLVANNGSGKSRVILARIATFLCSCKVRHKTIVSSASFDQLKYLTFKEVEDVAGEINSFLGGKFFECVECYVSCAATGSIIRGFATDQPGRVEGDHPNFGAEMAVLLDEGKTIRDDMFSAFLRLTGYNIWLETSSPGSCSGHFFRSTVSAARKWPEPLELGKSYARKVTAFDCPHISIAHIERVKQLEGENSIIYRSSILAEFTSIDDKSIIRQEDTIYTDPAPNTYGLEPHAGLDLSLGGDETVLSVWQGNRRRAQYTWHIKEHAVLLAFILEAFSKEGLRAENINADGGGLGKPIIQRIRELGWEINSINNESSAANKREYLNRGIELWFKIKRLIEERILILPRDDDKLLNQIVTRRYTYANGKLKLEAKADAKSRGGSSPDRADAMVLAFAHIPRETFLLNDSPAAGKFYDPQQPLHGVTLETLQAGLERRRAAKDAAEPAATGFTTNVLGTERTSRFSSFLSRGKRGFGGLKLNR